MIIIPLIICVFLILYAYFFSDTIIFQPQPASYRDTNEILKLTTRDGNSISAIYLPNSNAIYTILYSHGNAEDIGDILPVLKKIGGIGFSVFAYDYHGYGTSTGKASEVNSYQDIDAAYEYLSGTLNVPSDRIISFGHSVGGGPAVDLASRTPVAALIIESSFTTAFRVLTRVRLLPFDKFRNLEKIKQVKCPILIIHGKADPVIPFWHSQELFDCANEPKRLLLLDQAGHNNPMWGAEDIYSRTLREFCLSIGG